MSARRTQAPITWYLPPVVVPLTLALAACAPSPRWYEGNLHTHSYWSDGDQFPEVILRRYREQGYDFVALSDHNVLAHSERWVAVDSLPNGGASLAEYRRVFGDEWVERRTDASGLLQVRLKRFDEYAGRVAEPGRFLVIQGEEISDQFASRPLHGNATNLAGSSRRRVGRVRPMSSSGTSTRCWRSGASPVSPWART